MLVETGSRLLMASLGLSLFGYASASCECGHNVYLNDQAPARLLTDSVQTDFLSIKSLTDDAAEWRAQSYNKTKTAARGPYGEMFTIDDVIANPASAPGVNLVVGSKIVNGLIPTAEIANTRSDFYYGSYRASLKITRDSGTCAAFYWYWNDTQEIDMEFLSVNFDYQRKKFPINIVLHSPRNLDPDYDASEGGTWAVKNLPFDPTDDFHEYGFDWAPGRVTFYADGQAIGQMNGDVVPNHAGRILLSHWSNGDPQWSGGPPTKNASMQIRSFYAYFNSTDAAKQSDWKSRCASIRQPNDAFCTV